MDNLRHASLILSCEHAGNKIPAWLSSRIVVPASILSSHRGWDAGALTIAKALSIRLRAPFYFSEVSRLVVDLNRTLGHHALMSEFSRELPKPLREKILARHYLPHWQRLKREVNAKHGLVLHLAFHSFTPVYRGYRRKTDLGLLFDPKRKKEFLVARQLRKRLNREFPELKIHFNRPYRGSSDGLTTSLRLRNPRYLGLELEINQRLLKKGAGFRTALLKALKAGLDDVVVADPPHRLARL